MKGHLMKKPLPHVFARCCLGELLAYITLVSSIVFIIQLFFTPVIVVIKGLSVISNASTAQPATPGLVLLNGVSVPVVIYCPERLVNASGVVEVLASSKLSGVLGGANNTAGSIVVLVGSTPLETRITGVYADASPSLKPASGCQGGLNPLQLGASGLVSELQVLEGFLGYFGMFILFTGSLLLAFKREDDLGNTAMLLREMGASGWQVFSSLLVSILLTAVFGVVLGFSISLTLSRLLIVAARYVVNPSVTVSPYITTSGFAHTALLITTTVVVSHLPSIVKIGWRVRVE
jgi:hypothetical protein